MIDFVLIQSRAEGPLYSWVIFYKEVLFVSLAKNKTNKKSAINQIVIFNVRIGPEI